PLSRAKRTNPQPSKRPRRVPLSRAKRTVLPDHQTPRGTCLFEIFLTQRVSITEQTLGKIMAFAGTVVLLLIAVTIAANMHPEGPVLVILLFWACPTLLGGLAMMADKRSVPAIRVGGMLMLLLGLFLMSLFFRIL
ncbi:MAG: hypothetical protein ACNA7J_15055, partial [Wenzhouxiangella sp.]